MSNRKSLIIMLVLALFIAGCGTKQAVDTTDAGLQVGMIDMNKAVKGHPQYNQFVTLGQQADAMVAQFEAQQSAVAQQDSAAGLPDMAKQQMAELHKGFEQEFNSRMSAKQEELSRGVAAKADTANQTLSAEMHAYNEQLDKEYQPLIFNLHLKLKTVQLPPEEVAILHAELDKIQNQRAAALAEKQAQLAVRMNELLAPEKAAIERQLAAYAQELDEELSRKAAAKETEIAARGNMTALQTQQTLSPIQEQLAIKKQEIQALQQSILADIKDKTAKIGAESGLEVVLTNVAVNVNAMDITTQVITECNK